MIASDAQAGGLPDVLAGRVRLGDKKIPDRFRAFLFPLLFGSKFSLF